MSNEQTREQFLLAWNSNAYIGMCTSEDMKNVIDALDKQIPKKPIKYEDNIHDKFCICLECPTCGSFIGYGVDCKDEEYQINNCCGCGQALDWSKEDE